MGNISLSFAGHFGTEVSTNAVCIRSCELVQPDPSWTKIKVEQVQELAAAALSNSLTFMFGRLPLIGLSCALDTMASQVP